MHDSYVCYYKYSLEWLVCCAEDNDLIELRILGMNDCCCLTIKVKSTGSPFSRLLFQMWQVQNEVQPTARSTTKFSRSQSKQKPKDAMDTVAPSSSLFQMLRRSAVQQHSQNTSVGSTDSVFASFKLPKRSKIESKF